MIDSEEAAMEWLRSLPEAGPDTLGRLHKLVELLRSENTRQNLVSALSLNEVWRRHIADSAQLLIDVPHETSVWLDLGAGAGFPGLVIATLRPDMMVTLIESRIRRAEWLRHTARALGLGHVDVLGDRVERIQSFEAGYISARAFAPLDKILQLSSRFSTADTLWVLPKGRSAQQELQSLQRWQHSFHVKQSLTDPESGIIVGRLAGRKGKSA